MKTNVGIMGQKKPEQKANKKREAGGRLFSEPLASPHAPLPRVLSGALFLPLHSFFPASRCCLPSYFFLSSPSPQIFSVSRFCLPPSIQHSPTTRILTHPHHHQPPHLYVLILASLPAIARTCRRLLQQWISPTC